MSTKWQKGVLLSACLLTTVILFSFCLQISRHLLLHICVCLRIEFHKHLLLFSFYFIYSQHIVQIDLVSFIHMFKHTLTHIQFLFTTALKCSAYLLCTDCTQIEFVHILPLCSVCVRVSVCVSFFILWVYCNIVN